MDIDWAYMRKGWKSCQKAQAVLDQNNTTILKISDARKDKLESDGAWKVLNKTSTLVITKGKKILEFVPSSTNKEEILGHALGRSGTLRAPTLIIADKIVVGYQDDLYSNLFK